MKRIVILLSFLLAFQISTQAQTVHIPDPNLRVAIHEALKLPARAPITQEDMKRLERLSAYHSNIIDLSGLEIATQLENLSLGGNPISDLRPLTGLTNIRRLILPDCQISDISPLSDLRQLVELNARNNPISDLSPLTGLITLKYLDLSECLIVDIAPLSDLVNLEVLQLNHNQIVNVRPLSTLTSLRKLEIHRNLILNHSPLDSLSLDIFRYDQTCEMPPLPLEPRLENRTYPSIVARWSGYGWPPISNRLDLSDAENIAHHDLWFHGDEFRLRMFEVGNEFRLVGNVDEAIHLRNELVHYNPNLIILLTITMRAADLVLFPSDWPYWIRDEQGNIFRRVDDDGIQVDHGFIDFTHPVVQDQIVQHALAVSKCGLYDGIFFDFWSEEWRVLGGRDGTRTYLPRSLEAELQARLNIVHRIRVQTRPNFLIMGNTNDRIIPRTGPYLNGGFMETSIPESKTGIGLEDKVSRVENSLLWLEQNLREPRINALEGDTIPTETPDSLTNLRWMRALTTLSLTHSDGYVLFSDSNQHGHNWYDFWDANLGRPVGDKAQLYQDTDGLYIREFTNGWAVYNHSGSAQVITLPEEAQGVASNLAGTEHEVANLDGEMYLRVTPANPADVNEDGVVNILDLILVAQAIGTEKSEPDVNGDGVINVFDLVMVAGAIGGGGAAPSAYSPDLSNISAADVERWLAQVQGLGVGDANFQRGIRFLEQLLAALTPKETALLPNYPNPFNPETWIPYRLAREAEVVITIYDTKGTLVRWLALGNQEAGHYAERGKAAYWDGRNEDGEAVASGIYIYQFRAGDYAASRRMVIVK